MTGRSSRTIPRTSSSIARFSSSVSARSNGKSKRRYSGVDERAGLLRPLADDVPQRAMEQVRAGVVAHRVRAPVGVDLGRHRVADGDPAPQRAALHDQPGGLRARHALRVLDLEHDVATAVLGGTRRTTPRSPIWPPPSA